MEDLIKNDSSAPKPHSKAGWIFGGMSFIPLIGILFGIIAIIFGVVKKIKGQIFLGIAGILFTIAIYGSLFYFGFVAKTGVYANLRVQLTAQIMRTDAGQIALYKTQHGTLPTTFNDLGAPSQTNMLYTTDPWGTQLKYVPESNGKFELISAGPDKAFGTPDDIAQMY